MGKNKLDAVTFSKLYDMFGEEAARDTLNDVNGGESTNFNHRKVSLYR